MGYLRLLIGITLLAAAAYPILSQQPSLIGDTLKFKLTASSNFTQVQTIKVESNNKRLVVFDPQPPSADGSLQQISLSVTRTGEDTEIATCEFIDTDPCYFSLNSVKQKLPLQIKVSSKSQVIVSFKTFFAEVQELMIGQMRQFTLTQSHKSHFYYLNLTNHHYQRLRILLYPQGRRQNFDYVSLYGGFGKDSAPNRKTHNFKSAHLWAQTEGVFIDSLDISIPQLMLSIVGSTHSKYKILCEQLNYRLNDLKLNNKVYEYLHPLSQAHFFINFTEAQQLEAQSEFVIAFQTFSGDTHLEIYTDSALTKRDLKEPFEHIRDVQLIYSAQEVQQKFPSGLYIKLSGQTRRSTFMVELRARKVSQFTTLSQNFFDFINVPKMDSNGNSPARDAIIQLKVERGDNETMWESLFVTILSVQGIVEATFYSCRIKNVKKCLSERNSYATVFEAELRDQNHGKHFSHFNISKAQIGNDDESQFLEALILIQLKQVNSKESSKAVVAMNYAMQSPVEMLRENYPIDIFMLEDQIKYFKYSWDDPYVTSAKLVISVTSGDVSCYYSFVDPVEITQIDRRSIQSTVLEVTSRPISGAIYITIEAIDESIVVLSLSITYNTTSSKSISSNISMSLNAPQHIKISPQGKEVLTVKGSVSSHKKNRQLQFNFDSTGFVTVCASPPGCDPSAEGFQGSIPFVQTGSFQISNPSKSHYVEVTVVAKRHECCLQGLTNQLYSRSVKDKRICQLFSVDLSKEVELMIVRSPFTETASIYLTICGQKVEIEGSQSIYSVKRPTKCRIESHFNVQLEVVLESEPTGVEKSNKQIVFALQYPQESIGLLNGVAYHVEMKLPTGLNQAAERLFYYDIVNIIDTSLIVTLFEGQVFIKAAIIKRIEKVTFKSSNEMEISAVAKTYHEVKLKFSREEILQKGCSESVPCSLMVVTRPNAGQTSNKLDYSLEIVEGHKQLKFGAPFKDFLNQGSVGYYWFANEAQNRKIFISVSDNNQQCVVMRVSSQQFPSELNTMKTEAGNLLSLDYVDLELYYLAIQAQRDCSYSIVVTSAASEIVQLNQGQSTFLQLEPNSTKYYLYRHNAEKTFRVMALTEFGTITFSVNATSPEVLVYNKGNIDARDFQLKALKKDLISVDPKQMVGGCYNCYYLIAASTYTFTKTNIVVVIEETAIPLFEDRVMSNFFEKAHESIHAKYYNVIPSQVEVRMLSGSVSLLIECQNFTLRKEYKFDDDNAVFLDKVYIERIKDSNWEPAQITLTSKADETLFSFKITSLALLEAKLKEEGNIELQPGQPSSFTLAPTSKACLIGKIKSHSDRIALTADKTITFDKAALILEVKCNKESTQAYSISLIRNSMMILFDPKKWFEGISFQVCIHYPLAKLSLTALQADPDLSVLPSAVDMIVDKPTTFLLRPEGEFILDVFRCEEGVQVLQSATYYNLQSNKTRLGVQQNSMPGQDHAVKLVGTKNFYVKVSGHSVIRWLPLKVAKELGTGYLNYGIGELSYTTWFNSLMISVEMLKPKKTVNNSIVLVRYDLVVTDSLQKLKLATQCGNLSEDATRMINIGEFEQNSLKSMLLYTITKTDAAKLANGAPALYFNVVADLTIRSHTENFDETYRFIYHAQQIPREMFVPTALEQTEKQLLLGVALLALGVIVWIGYLCAYKIIPMAIRVKTRLFLEEDLQFDEPAPKATSNDDNNNGLEPPNTAQRLN